MDCGAIFEIPTDPFVLFGLTRSWAVDAAALDERYTALSRAIREKSAAREELRERAAEATTALDRARLRLLDPIERAKYLLTAYGGSEREKPLRKREFQSEIMEFDRSATKAREDGDPARLGGIVIEAEEKLASAIMAAGQSFTRLERSLVEEVSAAADAVAEARFWRRKVDELRAFGRGGRDAAGGRES
jgi:DnaJ-domain-containing protein 1